MIIKVEPDLEGMAESVELVYDVAEASPFRVTVRTSHRCVAEDLFTLAQALDGILIPVQLVTRGRAS